MKHITARYDTLIVFKIPNNVFLLPLDENETAVEGAYGSWWVKWGVLNYYDKHGKTRQILPSVRDTDTKWTDDIDEEIIDSDEE